MKEVLMANKAVNEKYKQYNKEIAEENKAL